MSIKELEQFKSVSDKFDSLYTVVVYSTDIQEFIKVLYKKLKIVQKVKNDFKRKYLNNRLYSFVNYMEQGGHKSPINSLYLVGKEIFEYKLQKKHIGILKEFNVDKILIKSDGIFDIDYINSLLTDRSYREIIFVRNNKLRHIYLNETKRKVINEEEEKSLDVEKYIKENVKSKCLVHGVSAVLKNLKLNGHHVIKKHLTDNEIKEFYRREEMAKRHIQLKEYISMMQREDLMHRVKCGKDLQKAIRKCMIKEVLCSKVMARKIEERIPKELQNFQIIIIESLEKCDIGEDLVRNYSGIIGLTYY